MQDLRHTHATLLLKSGEQVRVISERFGHSTAFTPDTYAAIRGCNVRPRTASATAS